MTSLACPPPSTPIIVMSQNRQDKKDRLRSELDFEVNRRPEAENQSLSHRLSLVMDKMCGMEEGLRDVWVRWKPASYLHQKQGSSGFLRPEIK